MIKVRGIEIPVDVRGEVEQYEWDKPNWRGDRLIACSPFREERSPSFAVNFDNGTFIDSGGDGEYRAGNFTKLLSFLRNEPYEDTEEYLMATYSPYFAEIEALELPTMEDWHDEPRSRKTYTRDDLTPFQYKHSYLEGRGIPFNVQRAFDVGFHPETNSVVLVWHDYKGNIVNWKHRNVTNKLFWYAKGGQSIRNHLYGIHWVVKRGFKTVWIVESEIDALTLWAKGIPAVAIGSSYLSNEKRDILLKVGIESVVIATDNDKDGLKAKKSIIDRLGGKVDLNEVDWEGVQYKDINEARDIIEQLPIQQINMFLWDE